VRQDINPDYPVGGPGGTPWLAESRIRRQRSRLDGLGITEPLKKKKNDSLSVGSPPLPLFKAE